MIQVASTKELSEYIHGVPEVEEHMFSGIEVSTESSVTRRHTAGSVCQSRLAIFIIYSSFVLCYD